MTIRITGMNSGLDTEAIITELASARSVKVQKIEKNQTKLSWKIDAWKELNSKIYALYTDVLSDMRFDYAYSKKTTKISNPNAVSVVTSSGAVNGTQYLKVKQLAKSAYLTGAEVTYKVKDKDGKEEKEVRATKDTTLSKLGLEDGGRFKVTVGGEAKVITLNGTDTLANVASKLSEAGLNAKFDDSTGRFFVSAKESGKAGNFTFESAPWEYQDVPKAWDKLSEDEKKKVAVPNLSQEKWDALTADKKEEIYNKNKAAIEAQNAKAEKANETLEESYDVLMTTLGLKYNVYDPDKTAEKGMGTMIEGQDAVIELNGVSFTSSKNTFEINGLTITAQQETGDETVALTTDQDTDGIYDMIKNFITKYNELINEMDKLYNAKSASKYEPLTKDEKDAMSDTEVEEWEKKIKDSLLRRDSTLFSVSSAMKEVMLSGVNVNGKQMYLSMFGIETLGYFKAKDNEKNAYHIDGDSDDSSVKNNEDKLRAAIASDPDSVIEFFKQLSTNLYNKLDEKMARTDYSSSFTVYNDKLMEKELKDYESKISTEQKKLNDYIDRWYKKFSEMEVALSKINSKESSISSLFG